MNNTDFESKVSIEYKIMNKGIDKSEFGLHNSYEILFIINGSNIILFNDRYQELKVGDIVLFSPNESHKLIGNSQYELIFLKFSNSYLKKYYTEQVEHELLSVFKSRIVHADTNHFNKLCKMINILSNDYSNKNDMVFINIADILIYLSKINKPLPKNNPVSKQPINKNLSDIINYISENYSYNISTDDISTNCKISKSWIYRLFKNYLETTPMRFLNNIRILHACDILLTTNATITEVAMRCGFASTSYFENIFKQVTCQTPSMFRKSKK